MNKEAKYKKIKVYPRQTAGRGRQSQRWETTRRL